MTIQPTAYKNVYVLDYNSRKWFATPTEKVSKFNMVINHCPTVKIVEFTGFDKN
ncbi:hypothetical protein Y10_03570 [Neptunitalea sp. Y10]|uniref:Uncharacterized protein n=1 Tax=Neptunitalea lumnitzerae TaxID=2965509 RepID=A0ABQ5MEZ8_9FLAO|nr:hypothetical protein Y10_03570 [Neptunitalea sp. Y10]